MNFKKGDIVKVIKEDYFGDKVYHVGSVWEVVGTPSMSGLVMIKDSRQSSGNAMLFKNRVEIIKRFEPRFKIGDMVRVKSSIYSNDNSIGKVYKVENISTNLVGDNGIVYLDTGVNNDHTKTWIYRFYEIELVDVNKSYQHELEELTQAYEVLKNTNKKLEEDLFKEKEKSNRFLKHCRIRFDMLQEQFKEIDVLKEENKGLHTRISCLETEKIHYAQRVRALAEENEILKEDLERKKALKNFLTRKKG